MAVQSDRGRGQAVITKLKVFRMIMPVAKIVLTFTLLITIFGAGKSAEWSEEEDKILIQAHKDFGNSWVQISKRLPGRAENTIKNHWNTNKRRQSGKRLTRNSARTKRNRNLLQDYIESLDQNACQGQDQIAIDNTTMPIQETALNETAPNETTPNNSMLMPIASELNQEVHRVTQPSAGIAAEYVGNSLCDLQFSPIPEFDPSPIFSPCEEYDSSVIFAEIEHCFTACNEPKTGTRVESNVESTMEGVPFEYPEMDIHFWEMLLSNNFISYSSE